MNPLIATITAAGLIANNTWGRRRPKPPPPGNFIRIDGRRIHYVERPGHGVPVVLLHGMPGTHLDYLRVVQALEGVHTVAVDRPGYGWSQGGPLTYPQQVDMVAELVAALGLGRALLVGHSFGGLLALGVAASHPDAVAGLALIAPSGGGLRSGPYRMASARLVVAMQTPGVRQLTEATVGGLLRRTGAMIDARFAVAPDPVDRHYAKRLNELTLHDDNLRAMARDRLSYHANIDWIDGRLPAIDVPASVLLAKGDKPIPIEHGRTLAAALPNSQLLEVDGGHMLPVAQPDVVADTITSALRAIRAA